MSERAIDVLVVGGGVVGVACAYELSGINPMRAEQLLDRRLAT